MNALRFARHGGLEVLSVAKVPVPVPGPGEVLVEVRAAGINPSDLGNVAGAFPVTTMPRTPGRDLAGVVVDGPEAMVGRAVWASGRELGFTRDGSHAAYLTVPAEGVALKPLALSFEAAARCGVPYSTAFGCLERTGAGAGTRLVVLGASGAVGRAAVDLGRWRGAEVVAGVRREAVVAELAADGVTPVVVPEPAALADTVRGVLQAGADVVIDATGRLLPEAVDLLAKGGRIAVVAAPRDERVPVPMRRFYHLAATLHGVDSLAWSVSEVATVLARLAEGFDTGALPPPPPPSVFPLAEAVPAYAAVAGRAVGKAVLVPGDADRRGRPR